MEYVSVLKDRRINSHNIAFEIKISEYLRIATKIIEGNVFQRKRVKSSSTIYALLKQDLKRGCIIPPIVIALNQNAEEIVFDTDDIELDDIYNLLDKKLDKLLILDGLQRTYTMLDLESELKDSDDVDELKTFHDHKIRVELYLSVNKLGILYRMLTLNTGQTPMSLRHQIEILYSDYLHARIEDIKFLREIDNTRATGTTEYNFKEVIEGFNSYLERNELPIAKFNLLDNIKGLEKLAKENENTDLFRSFIVSFHSFIIKLKELTENDWVFDRDEIDLAGPAFGTTIESIFKKSQVLTGFGAAIGRLKDFEIIDSIDEVSGIMKNIDFEDNIGGGINNLLLKLDEIRNNAKKIGNAQRMYFQYFFRELLNDETDSYPYIDKAIENAYQKYQSQTAL